MSTQNRVMTGLYDSIGQHVFYTLENVSILQVHMIFIYTLLRSKGSDDGTSSDSVR